MPRKYTPQSLHRDSSKCVRAESRTICLTKPIEPADCGDNILAIGHHDHNVTGCAASGPDGLELISESDQQTYSLVGDTGGIKPGDRVRVSAKKQKTGSGGPHQLLVDKLNKDFGACAVSPAHP